MSRKIMIWGRLVLLGCVIIFSNPISAEDSSTRVTNQINVDEPFTVSVTPVKKEYHTNDIINVLIKIENVTKTNQSIVMWTCSWWSQFQPANPQLGLWPGYACEMNFPSPVNIPPGKILEKELKLRVLQPCLTNRISFKIRFTPLDYTPMRIENGRAILPVVNDSKKSFLSNEAMIDLIPN